MTIDSDLLLEYKKEGKLDLFFKFLEDIWVELFHQIEDTVDEGKDLSACKIKLEKLKEHVVQINNNLSSYHLATGNLKHPLTREIDRLLMLIRTKQILAK